MLRSSFLCFYLFFYTLLLHVYAACAYSHGETLDSSLIKTQADDTLSVDSITWSLEKLLGKIDPAKDTDFVKVERKYTFRDSVFIQKEPYAAFIQMCEAAKADKIPLIIVSATRNFDEQKELWEAKWKGKILVDGNVDAGKIIDPIERSFAIMLYTAMPGTSRHQWGTDIDLNSVERTYFQTPQGKRVYEWLKNNAGKFGFCQTYTKKNPARPDGYEEEKWHWSFTSMADEYYNQYLRRVSYTNLTGFSGAEQAEKMQVIEKFVSGISEECR